MPKQRKKTRNENAFHAPLHALDAEKQTYGCRHTNPDICARYHMPKICAYARNDNICLSPPKSWAKQFAILKLKSKKG